MAYSDDDPFRQVQQKIPVLQHDLVRSKSQLWKADVTDAAACRTNSG